MSQPKHDRKSSDGDTQNRSFNEPNPVFVHYDRGLQEYGDLFSDDDASLEESETAETQSHRT